MAPELQDRESGEIPGELNLARSDDVLEEYYAPPLDFYRCPAIEPRAKHCPTRQEGGNEDSSVRSLSTEAQRLYRQANAAYQKDAGRFYAYICIHSGRRSVQEQARLYKSWRRSVHGVPSAPKANLPGTSIHEYGFAIDVIRGSDEARIVSALSGAGWTQHAGNEGWHFEAKSANNWSDLEDYIGRIRPNEPSALGGKIESGVLSEVELLAVRDYIARMTPVLESEKEGT